MGKEVSLDNVLFPEFGGKEATVVVPSDFAELFEKIGVFIMKMLDGVNEVDDE